MNIPNGALPARALILDRELIRRVYADRTARGNRPHDEVWDGLLVLLPLPDNEHREVTALLTFALASVTPDGVYPGVNVSDRADGWLNEFRCPDAAVYLSTNPAKDAGTHWVGGPDLLVEVVSPGEDPRQKLPFYAKVNTREVLIVDRDPWALELYHLHSGQLILAGRSDTANPAVLASGVLPLTFRLQPGTPRPKILAAHAADGRTWTA